jgi:glycosyltransferase involved in cell wall biosynthesis
MQEISIVIICKNEVAVIEQTILAAQKLTNQLFAVDTGSKDGTLEILYKHNVNCIKTNWQGFGPTKNIGIAAATTDWILSLDADERLDEELIVAIKNCDLSNENFAYGIHFLNYFGATPIQYGEWSGDYHTRLFNKKNVLWNDAAVHEELLFKNKPILKKLSGYIHHQTVKDRTELQFKLDKYAKLNARHYFVKKKKNGTLKKVFSPVFNFIKNYFFKLGFLDGKAGYIVAIENAKYTYKKYLYLQQFKK